MTDEGKISRAIAKSGGGEKLSSSQQQPGAGSVSGAHDGRHSRPGSPGFERVQGRCGEPGHGAVMVHDPLGEASSHIRAVRAKILAMNNGNPPRVITVSSGAREEGKTTIAFNLAVALSEVDDGRAVVVDGDLPCPGLHSLAGVEADTGLNEILENDLKLDGSVYETVVPGVDVIPSRAISAGNGFEGLLAQHCAQLLADLRRSYSYVLIDAPPVLAGSQACTFGQHSDGVLLIARLEKAPRDVVKRAMDELTHSGARVIGCVLTHRRHHVPNIIYRFFGNTPRYYYGYGRKKK